MTEYIEIYYNKSSKTPIQHKFDLRKENYMTISDLAAYAQEKYHIAEDHKWQEFPGFSVLVDPVTGKWAALLMRQWDSETGTELQRCDIKCGRQALEEYKRPYLSGPFRMKGQKWVGVQFTRETEPEIVHILFDRALRSGDQRGYTIVLDEKKAPSPGLKGLTKGMPEKVYRDTALPPRDQFRRQQDRRQQDRKPPARIRSDRQDDMVPEPIRDMMRLYQRGDGSFRSRCRNFYLQGMSMENYEDDLPWETDLQMYFPTYHDLNVRQLRGYFTWRTQVRKGEYRKTASAFAYIYLYELLNGIGEIYPEDRLRRMQEFETRYLGAGYGDEILAKNLRRWMTDFCVCCGLPLETACRYADPETMKRDAAIEVLRGPQDHTDEEIYEAMCFWTGKRLGDSTAVKKEGERAKRLFAQVYRKAEEGQKAKGEDLFAACFDKKRVFPWSPLGNAVYWDRSRPEDVEYVLNACRRYIRRGVIWQEERYEDLFFDKAPLRALVHETERLLRKYFNTGHYLKKKEEEAWVTPYAEAVIEEEKVKEEAARTAVTIDFTGLDRIRSDAALTRESLLTKEERSEEAETVLSGAEPEKEPEKDDPVQEAGPAGDLQSDNVLDPVQRRILRALLEDGPADAIMREAFLMPSVVADAINEALFDEFGDSVVECDNDRLTIVEDYRADLEALMG